MSRTLRLTREHLRRFAEASGDRNPLHVDETYARATPYGRCIAQGALVSIAALGDVAQSLLERAGSLQVKFAHPVFPEEEYAVAGVSEADRVVVDVSDAGRAAVTVTFASEPGAPALGVPTLPETSGPVRTTPLERSLRELVPAGFEAVEPYRCDLDSLHELAAELGAGEVPRALLLWLAAASFSVGMLVPGRDAVFAGARIERAAAGRAGALSLTVTAADDRTGLVVVDGELGAGEASARMTLTTFLREPVPTPERAAVARYLAPSAALTGSTVLVVGGSRGLGAASAGALATQGATVYSGYARSDAHAERLREALGVRPLRFDAEDPEETRAAVAALRREAAELDGVVFCAAPPLYDGTLHPSAAEPALRFVRRSLAMVLHPLAEALPALAPGGWLVFVSSTDLDDPREGWAHYAAAKGALEGVAAYCACQTGADVLVARPPRMWTDSTNTPLGRLGAVPAEQVAAAIARWATLPPGTRPGRLSGEELLPEPLAPEA